MISGFIPSESFPCVGASIGFERIFTFLTYLKKAAIYRGYASMDEMYSASKSQFIVCEVGRDGPEFGFYRERLELLTQLRTYFGSGSGSGSSSSEIYGEMLHKISPNFREQISFAEDRNIRWMVIIGASELKKNTVNVRRLVLVGDYIELKTKDKSRDKKIVQIVKIEQPTSGGKRATPFFYVRPVADPSDAVADADATDSSSSKSKKKKKGKSKGKGKSDGLWRMTKKEMGRVVTRKGTADEDIIDQQILGMPREEVAQFLAKHI